MQTWPDVAQLDPGDCQEVVQGVGLGYERVFEARYM
jgi:hypothetical protein